MKKGTVKIKKLNPLEKMLKSHLPHCKMGEYSLMEDRHCTCGLEDARDIYDNIKVFLTRMDIWLEENPSLGSNSFAHVELDRLLERLK